MIGRLAANIRGNAERRDAGGAPLSRKGAESQQLSEAEEREQPKVNLQAERIHVASSGVLWCATFQDDTPSSSGCFWYLLPDVDSRRASGLAMSYRRAGGRLGDVEHDS